MLLPLKVLIVAGGCGPHAPFDPVDSTHDSTEKLLLLPGNEWTAASSLPRRSFNMASVSLNNKVYLVGK